MNGKVESPCPSSVGHILPSGTLGIFWFELRFCGSIVFLFSCLTLYSTYTSSGFRGLYLFCVFSIMPRCSYFARCYSTFSFTLHFYLFPISLWIHMLHLSIQTCHFLYYIYCVPCTCSYYSFYFYPSIVFFF